MKSFVKLVLVSLAILLLSAAAYAQNAVEVHIMWYNDGNEGEVLQDLLTRFEKDNPGIRVVVDTVPYSATQDQLPLAVQSGQAPDMARVTNYTTYAGNYLDLRPLLKDAKYFDDNFPASSLQALRTGDDTTGLYGFPNQFTVTGPYINRTLFEQAKIDVPSDTNQAVTWEEWTEVAKKVAEATGTKYAVAMDRSGHRFSGPALSEGASYYNADGSFHIDTEGFRRMANIFIGWHEQNLTPAEIWVGSGGSYAAGADYFINGQLVLYMSGSWQVQNFVNKIGDKFDWVAVPNPTGPGGSTGMPGGTMLVAFKSTKHPQEVAQVMEYLASLPVLTEFTARTLFIPGHLGLAKTGVDYQTDSKLAKDALNVFLSEVPKLSAESYRLNNEPLNSVLFNSVRDRLTDVLSGDLTLDDAIARIQQTVDDAKANAEATAAPK
jgi:alpha-1,4-digalacturonate transport system substrate-binding protein